MWMLLQKSMTPLQPAATDKHVLAKAIADVKGGIAESKRLMDEISQIMAELAREGRQDTPEYRQVLASFQKLSRMITRASKELKDTEEQQIQEVRAIQAAPAARDLSGITPLKGTLGPAGTPGVVTRGPEVTNLQKFLSAVGFAVPTSGEFDVKTRLAVQQFQTKHQIKVTGTVGAEMRKVINDILKEPAPAGLPGPVEEEP